MCQTLSHLTDTKYIAYNLDIRINTLVLQKLLFPIHYIVQEEGS